MLRRRQSYEHIQWPLTCPAAAFHWASLTVCKWVITKAKRLEWKRGEHLMNHVFTYFYIRNYYVIWHTSPLIPGWSSGSFRHLMNFRLSFVRIFNQNHNNLKRYQLFRICVHLGTGWISVSLSSCFFFTPFPRTPLEHWKNIVVFFFFTSLTWSYVFHLHPPVFAFAHSDVKHSNGTNSHMWECFSCSFKL